MFSWFKRARKIIESGAADHGHPTVLAESSAQPAPSSAPVGTRSLSRPDDTIDYLNTPAVAAYFDAREHEAYYRALKRAGERRDFHARLIPVLERFIELTDSWAGATAVDRVMASSLRTERAAGYTAGGTPLSIARSRHPEGVTLLGIAEPLTFESLKSAYRVAAKRNHPDTGGSHDAMLAINEAFECTHMMLLRERALADAGVAPAGPTAPGTGEASDCNDYRYVCGELLFLVTLDDWNIDAAFTWLVLITSPQWQRSRYAQAPSGRTALTEPAATLAGRLALAGLHREAGDALGVARSGLQVAKSKGLFYDPYVRRAEDVVEGRKGLQVVINHCRQADHALRLGVIDAMRHRSATARIISASAVDDGVEEQLRQFCTNIGFLQNLPTDRAARGKVPQSRLVPEPGYYVTRLAQLTEDQQAEYLIAFGPDAKLPLVHKYIFVRLVSLLESVLLHPGQVDDGAAEREAHVLATLREGSARVYATEVASVLAELRRSPTTERHARAALLSAIDSGDSYGVGVGGVEILGMSGSPPLTAEYFKTIRRTIEDLRAIQQTGRPPDTEADRRERETLARDLETLRAPSVRASEGASFAARTLAKTDPEAAARQLVEHCELLLDLGNSMLHVEQLQLGYWINRLTITLVGMRRWREAHAWLQRYFGLPERYRGRSNPTAEARMRNRLARCAEML